MTEELAIRKARGAFFTPPVMSRFIADWALRKPTDVVLEPSCGEASFLIAAAERLRLLGAPPTLNGSQLRGIEVHSESAEAAASVLSDHGLQAEITVSDFFDVPPMPTFDAVIGNPPYVRYQQFAGEARAKGLQAALAQGVRLNGLASSWAAFTVHAAQCLKPNGRLGLVLPAELLAVKYAAQVRRFLLERFASVRLVMFEELVFPGVLEEVVLLLAEGVGPSPCFEVFQARSLDDLGSHDGLVWTGHTPKDGDKWTGALLPIALFERYQQIAASSFTRMLHWGDTYLGSVTGNNNYFTVTAKQAAQLRFPKRELLRISPPGSRHLRGLSFTEAAWETLAKQGSPCYLVYPDIDRPSPTAKEYIAKGEKDDVDGAYKCRNRKPWWRVPTVPRPDLLLTYMDHDRPRLTTNNAEVHHLNSLYGVTLKPEHRSIGRELLPIGCLNSVTLLGAEMVGRSYGGGLLKLEPTEADILPVPSPELLERAGKELRPLRPQLTSALRQGKLNEAAKLVDRVLLKDHLGQTDETIRFLRQARDVLLSRRISRSRPARGPS